jgi:hypothetical protein
MCKDCTTGATNRDRNATCSQLPGRYGVVVGDGEVERKRHPNLCGSVLLWFCQSGGKVGSWGMGFVLRSHPRQHTSGAMHGSRVMPQVPTGRDLHHEPCVDFLVQKAPIPAAFHTTSHDEAG